MFSHKATQPVHIEFQKKLPDAKNINQEDRENELFSENIEMLQEAQLKIF